MKNKDTKDLVMKDFEAYPDVAADLLNVFLHEGQQRVKQKKCILSGNRTGTVLGREAMELQGKSA